MRHIGSGVPPSRRGEYILELSMTTLTTTCPMDCPDTCALEVTVEEGRIASIRGAKDHPTTAGFICSKVAHFDRRVYHSDRLLYPMRRTGPKGSGEFRRVSWEEAIGEITSRVRKIISRWGAEAILPYHYGGSKRLFIAVFLRDFYFFEVREVRRSLAPWTVPLAAL